MESFGHSWSQPSAPGEAEIGNGRKESGDGEKGDQEQQCCCKTVPITLVSATPKPYPVVALGLVGELLSVLEYPCQARLCPGLRESGQVHGICPDGDGFDVVVLVQLLLVEQLLLHRDRAGWGEVLSRSSRHGS